MLNIYLTCEKIWKDTHMFDMCIFDMFNTSLKHLCKIYIDLIVIYRVSAISKPYNGGVKCIYKKKK